MCLLILLAWILHTLAAPAIIWVVYWIAVVCWAVNGTINLFQLAMSD